MKKTEKQSMNYAVLRSKHTGMTHGFMNPHILDLLKSGSNVIIRDPEETIKRAEETDTQK